MDVEVEFLQQIPTEWHSKLLMDHIQKMESGEAPFLPMTLSLIYSTLVRKALPQPTTSGSGPKNLGIAKSEVNAVFIMITLIVVLWVETPWELEKVIMTYVILGEALLLNWGR